MRTLLCVGLAGFLGAEAAMAQASCSASPREAQVMAPHLADSARLFRAQLSPDGTELYYFKKVTLGQEDYRIFRSSLVNGSWSQPERILIAGEFSELYPTLTPDGNRLILSSYQPVPGDTASHPNAYLYVSSRTEAGWSPPVLQRQAITPGWYHSGPMIGPDGALYFSVTSPDWRTIITMRSEWNGREYGPASPYLEAERWRNWETDMRVWGAQPMPGDTVMLIYASPRKPEGGFIGTDLFATYRRAGAWTEPRPLRAGVNTAGTDSFASVSPDGCDLIFTRDYSRFYRVALSAALPPPP